MGSLKWGKKVTSKIGLISGNLSAGLTVALYPRAIKKKNSYDALVADRPLLCKEFCG